MQTKWLLAVTNFLHQLHIKRTDGNSCTTQRLPYFSPLAGISTHGIYDFDFSTFWIVAKDISPVLLCDQRYLSFAQKLSPRWDKVRSSGELSPGGMLMAMAMVNTSLWLLLPSCVPAVFSQPVPHSLFWCPVSFELLCLESEIIQLVFSSKGCIRPGVFQRNALTYIVEILTTLKCRFISSPSFQAWNRSAKYLLIQEEMSYKFSMTAKKNQWVKWDLSLPRALKWSWR